MKENILNNYEQLCSVITDEIIEQIKYKPKSVITIAGGQTPTGVYKMLSERLISEQVDYSKITFVSLDEWVGLDINTNGSCIETLSSHLFNNLNLNEDQIVFFNGVATNLTAECNRIDNIIAKLGGIDFMVLGIGMNGHLGFNEPNIITENSSIVSLAEKTKEVMTKYFDKQIELTHGITLGYKQIMETNKIILMASGAKKSKIIEQTIKSEASYDIPSTILKKHSNCQLLIDKDAKEVEA